MRYALYWTWNDGTKDTDIVYCAEDRDKNIKNMIDRKEFIEIGYSKIYVSGEYGKYIKIL